MSTAAWVAIIAGYVWGVFFLTWSLKQSAWRTVCDCGWTSKWTRWKTRAMVGGVAHAKLTGHRRETDG